MSRVGASCRVSLGWVEDGCMLGAGRVCEGLREDVGFVSVGWAVEV